MSTDQLTYSGTLVIRRCWCGIRHAIPEELDRWANASKTNAVCCPLGHEWVIADNATDREREARIRAEAREHHLQDQLQASERSKAALKGVVTRTKRRVGNGVCPVRGCKRHFKNVEAHISRMHPEYHEGAQS